MSVSTFSMANGGFKFLLLTFQCLVSWLQINLVISMNLFRLVYYKSIQRRSLCAVRYAARVARVA